MLFGDPKLFAEARDAKLGRIALAPALAQLRAWVSTEYSVSVVHVVYDAIERGPAAGRPRLDLILETAADLAAQRQDAATIRPEVRERALRMFTHLVAMTAPDEYDTNDVLLILDDFSDACLAQASEVFLREDSDMIISAFPDASIWGIEGFARALVVFFQTDADVRQKQADGTCARIAQRCRELASRHDEFGYLTPATFRLKFDSKQTLDRDYAGNLYYYFK